MTSGRRQAAAETAEGRVYTVGGQDWDEVVAATDGSGDGRRGAPGRQHGSAAPVDARRAPADPELDGETVTELRPVVGYLHTGIEKNMEFRTWTQGVTFCTRMDYLAPFFNETAYCLGVERAARHQDAVPERRQVIRVLMMELNRISSHLVGHRDRSAWSSARSP